MVDLCNLTNIDRKSIDLVWQTKSLQGCIAKKISEISPRITQIITNQFVIICVIRGKKIFLKAKSGYTKVHSFNSI